MNPNARTELGPESEKFLPEGVRDVVFKGEKRDFLLYAAAIGTPLE